jgi:hypothetical protein
VAEKPAPDDDRYSDEEAARRRDATVRAMIATPPQPKRTPGIKQRPTPKGRADKAKI